MGADDHGEERCRIDAMSLPRRVKKAIASLLGAPGETATSLRQAVFDRVRLGTGEVPENLRSLVEKIADRPWSVSDDDITLLRRSGYSEDHIYELVLAAAAGAGLRRFEAGLSAIEGAR
jgi:hypothetical protein